MFGRNKDDGNRRTSCLNERRALNWRNKPWPHTERRVGERRHFRVSLPARDIVWV